MLEWKLIGMLLRRQQEYHAVILEQNKGKSCTKLGQFGRVSITCPFDELYRIAGGCAKTSSWL